MSKEKMKLKDICALEKNSEINDEINAAFIEEFDKLAGDFLKKADIEIQFPIVKNKKELLVKKCFNCGEIVVDERKPNFMVCPHCGKRKAGMHYGSSMLFYMKDDKMLTDLNIWALYGGYRTRGDIFVIKHDDIYIFAKVSCIVTSVKSDNAIYEEGERNDWLTDSISKNYKVTNKIYFREDLGFRYVTEKGGLSTLAASSSYNVYSKMNTGTLIDSDIAKEVIAVMEKGKEKEYSPDSLRRLFGETAQKYNASLVALKEKDKKIEETDSTALLGSLPKETIMERSFLNNKKLAIAEMIENNGNTIHYVIGCPKCKKVSYGDIDVPNSCYTPAIETKCPHCGKELYSYLYMHTTKPEIVQNFSFWQKFDGGVAVRNGRFTVSFDGDDELKVSVSDLIEKERILFFPKKIEVYRFEQDADKKSLKWKKSSAATVFYVNPYYSTSIKTYCCNTEDELIEIINSSHLKFTGIQHAWGLGEFKDYKVEDVGEYKRGGFLWQWYKKPYLEFLVKSGLKRLTSDYMNEKIIRRKDATNVMDFLEITKAGLKAARELNFDKYQMDAFREMTRQQPDLTADMWLEIERTGTDPYTFARICRDTDTKLKKMMEYLESCYNNQCIEKREALTIYGDYYNMAKKVGFNLADKNIKFPSSLKKEHDRATFAYRVIEDQIKIQNFIENIERYKKYAFSDKEYTVIFPETPDEVVREGQLQHHCVASYVNMIEEGKTCICFIRKKETPEVPFFTCELRDGKIFQVKGFSNKYPSISDGYLIDFIHKWAKAKNLREEYTKH